MTDIAPTLTGPVAEPLPFDLTLLANFVHQVVNPLNGVAGTLDNLAEGVIKEEARREQRLKAARAQLEQCITLMRNLAFLARGSGGVSDSESRKIVMPQVIIESMMFYQEDGSLKDIQISLKDRTTQNKVIGHPELVRQVLMNIFDNGIKYGKKGSVIEANQRIQSKTGMAVFEINSESEYPVLAADIPRLCDLSYRGDNARKSVASGTGLGLYICKIIVEQHLSGSFHIQANGRGGLNFTIKLPHGEAG